MRRLPRRTTRASGREAFKYLGNGEGKISKRVAQARMLLLKVAQRSCIRLATTMH